MIAPPGGMWRMAQTFDVFRHDFYNVATRLLPDRLASIQIIRIAKRR
jgi:hypothetical protein